jgi:hypothetical protein
VSLENEKHIRNAYQAAEEKDIEDFIGCFTDDGTFTDQSIGVTYRGTHIGDTVTNYGTAFPDEMLDLTLLGRLGRNPRTGYSRDDRRRRDKERGPRRSGRSLLSARSYRRPIRARRSHACVRSNRFEFLSQRDDPAGSTRQHAPARRPPPTCARAQARSRPAGGPGCQSLPAGHSHVLAALRPSPPTARGRGRDWPAFPPKAMRQAP